MTTLSISCNGPRSFTDPEAAYTAHVSVAGPGLSISRNVSAASMPIAIERGLAELLEAVVAGVDTGQLAGVLRLFRQEARSAIIETDDDPTEEIA